MSRRQAEPASMTTTTTINAEHAELAELLCTGLLRRLAVAPTTINAELAETAELLCSGLSQLFALTVPNHLAHVLFCGLGVLRGSVSANITKSRVSTE